MNDALRVICVFSPPQEEPVRSRRHPFVASRSVSVGATMASRSVAAASPAAHSNNNKHAHENGIGRRAEIQALQTAVRAGIIAEEAECFKELDKIEKLYRQDAIEFCKRLPTMRKREESRLAASAERLADRARLLLPVCVHDELASRNAILVEQERDRRLVVSQQSRDHLRVHTIEKLQLLVRGEDRKRYSYERNEAAEFDAIQAEYNSTPWKPTIKVLGTCPFARKAHCPFHDQWKMCHGMPVASAHYERSIVELVDSSMM